MISIKDDSVSNCSDYANALRAIGYALEAAKVEAFEVTCEAANYVVRVEFQKGKTRSFQNIWQRIVPSRRSKSSWAGPELIYTPQHLARLDRDGRLKRRGGGRPDPHSLPQALRAIGAYLDHKEARLIHMAKRGASITIRYESPVDGHKTEEFTPPSLYALFVQRYVRRSDRHHQPFTSNGQENPNSRGIVGF
jgi:hypothetical protein